MATRLELLVVDDDEVDVEAIRRALVQAGTEASIQRAATVSAGLEALRSAVADAVLVDYRLPDGDGLGFVREALAESRGPCPIILLTVVQDEEIGIRALQEGAQDYLIKSEITGPLLVRSIRYAMERARLQSVLLARHDVEAHRREVHVLDRLAADEPTPHTTRVFGIRSLREGSPTAFESFRVRYAEIVDLALDQRAYRVDHRLSDRLRRLADDLGAYHAGPRDVVDLHATVLRAADAAGTGSKLRVLAEEARVLVLELMGYLTQYYRASSIRSDALRPFTPATRGSP
ncbi:MAG: response regulator [Deltaproteobacteria bacterium]|nr:response regulator [Deltaproteobacteria bacterium]